MLALMSTKKQNPTVGIQINREKSYKCKAKVGLKNEELATQLDRLYMTVVILLDVVSVSPFLFISLL